MNGPALARLVRGLLPALSLLAASGCHRADPGARRAAVTASGAPDGAVLYQRNCSPCHGATGRGVPGVYPPLAGNPVASGPAGRMVHIVDKGLSGPLTVSGVSYNSTMPPFEGRLSSAEIAAILTHVRTSWGNHGGRVTAAEVERAKQ